MVKDSSSKLTLGDQSVRACIGFSHCREDLFDFGKMSKRFKVSTERQIIMITEHPFNVNSKVARVRAARN